MEWKKLIPHAAAVAIMVIAALMYCAPELQGKRIKQDDIVKNVAQSKEARDYREANGEEALWTTRVFSGMTMFHIGTNISTNVVQHFRSIINGWLPRTAGTIFAIFIGFYILLILLGVNHWLAMAMAIAYGFSSNLLVSIIAGHNTKVLSIAFLAPAVGGVLLALNGKRYIGSLVAMFFISVMILSNHYQIMYYFLLISLVIGVVYLYYAIREKTVNDLLKNIGLLVIAGIIALLPNVGKVYSTYDHSKETIRGGKSELSSNAEQKKGGGLDKEYAMRWSYGPLETFTIVVPSFMGGASGEALPSGGNVEQALGKFNVTKQQKEAILAQAPLYIGDQPFILGTVYFGAGFIFLFILALFVVSGKVRAWVIGIVALSFIMSWGRHFDLITGLLFEYFPLYNKFRTPSMAMAIAGFAIPLFGVYGLHRVFTNQADHTSFKKAFKMAIYVTGGMMVLLLLYGVMNDWTGPKDAQYQTKNSPWAIAEIYEALLDDRKGRYMSDWFISLIVMGATAGVVWLTTKGKLKLATAITVLGLVFVSDMWRVGKRYLNDDAFITTRAYENQFNPTPADQAILQDPDPHHRVINLTRSPWTDGLTCYHHENVGGHHAAKLQRYQDLIERELSTQLQKLNSGLMQSGNRIQLNPQVAYQMPVYNMLNTKYYIVQEDNPAGAVRNPAACGNAWFVSEIQPVASADAEMAALSNFDPLKTAIIHSEFETQLAGYHVAPNTDNSIQLVEFTPKYLKYNAQTAIDGLAVFSEIYYPQGWKAFIDGEPAEILRANYVLRAMKVPAGSHVIEMRFEPQSFTTGKNISLAGSVMFILFGAGMLFFYFKKREE